MGLGPYPEVDLKSARAMAAGHHKSIQSGIDPLEERAARKQQDDASRQSSSNRGTTFSAAAEDYIASHKGGWKNAKHADQWKNTLTTYAYPAIGTKPIADVTTDDVLAILKPIWETKTETASRVRSRIELVISSAKAKKVFHGENPAAWKGHLDALLPRPTRVKKVRNQPALPYERISLFMGMLRQRLGTSARALEFLILTAARSSEVREATWNEFDLEQALWTVPASRMKAGKEHRVPLSPAALAIINALPRTTEGVYVFQGAKRTAPLSDMTLTAIIRRENKKRPNDERWVERTTNAEVVPHGFRSTFRDWASDIGQYPQDLAESALAHTIRNEAERAYRRFDMLERRRGMMNEWANYCNP